MEALTRIRDPLVTVWPAFTEAMYLLNFSWRAQDALWELVLEETIRLLPVEAMERGEDSPLAVIKAIQEAAVGHPLLAGIAERP